MDFFRLLNKFICTTEIFLDRSKYGLNWEQTLLLTACLESVPWLARLKQVAKKKRTVAVFYKWRNQLRVLICCHSLTFPEHNSLIGWKPSANRCYCCQIFTALLQILFHSGSLTTQSPEVCPITGAISLGILDTGHLFSSEKDSILFKQILFNQNSIEIYR